MTFEPVVIIGQACLFPGALNSEQLWENILAGKNTLLPAKYEQWRVDPRLLLTKNNRAGDYIVTDKCGYVEGFEKIFNPDGFAIDRDIILSQDLVCRWLIHTAREAFKTARIELPALTQKKVGTIFGNLSYPTSDFNRYIESIWLAEQPLMPEQVARFKQSQNLNHPQHRFMSGYPAHFMAKALGLTARCYALDAACASSLYAIELACRELHHQRADLMLAGGINLTDGLFLNLGFSALQALSPTGQSRPLHHDADGLIPSQGVGLFVLKRLADAIADHDEILGVIRGVGLSNDGRSRGFLVPDQNGQIRAMRKAYEQSNIQPEEISWIECHATGTIVGDAIEINSMKHIFSAEKKISIGALKGNIGHTITASGAAALIKVLSAFKANCKPPTLYAPEKPNDALQQSPFNLSSETQSWSENKAIAAINCFGFGGNNAHLLVEKWQAQSDVKFSSSKTSETSEKIAIVGIGILAASAKNKTEFWQAWRDQTSLMAEYYPGLKGGYLASIELNLDEAHFPPADLKRAVGQQLAILKAAHEAMKNIQVSDLLKAGVWIGMGCDTEVARSGFGCRLTEAFPEADDDWLKLAHEAIRPTLEASDAIGAMPNIVANRLNAEFNFQAPSYSVSAEEASGLVALELGVAHLQNHSVDIAMVGAVDMCCEMGHRSAAVNMLPVPQQIPGDAAVVLVLKRLSDAEKNNDTIYAMINDGTSLKSDAVKLSVKHSDITKLFGHAHAASGLLHVAAGALMLKENKANAVNVEVEAYGGQRYVQSLFCYPNTTEASFQHMIERGLQDVRNGSLISNEEMKKRIDEW